MAQSKKQRAIQLYNEGVPIWQIADILDTTEAQVCYWVGKLY